MTRRRGHQHLRRRRPARHGSEGGAGAPTGSTFKPCHVCQGSPPGSPVRYWCSLDCLVADGLESVGLLPAMLDDPRWGADPEPAWWDDVDGAEPWWWTA